MKFKPVDKGKGGREKIGDKQKVIWYFIQAYFERIRDCKLSCGAHNIVCEWDSVRSLILSVMQSTQPKVTIIPQYLLHL